MNGERKLAKRPKPPLCLTVLRARPEHQLAYEQEHASLLPPYWLISEKTARTSITDVGAHTKIVQRMYVVSARAYFLAAQIFHEAYLNTLMICGSSYALPKKWMEKWTSFSKESNRCLQAHLNCEFQIMTETRLKHKTKHKMKRHHKICEITFSTTPQSEKQRLNHSQSAAKKNSRHARLNFEKRTTHLFTFNLFLPQKREISIFVYMHWWNHLLWALMPWHGRWLHSGWGRCKRAKKRLRSGGRGA